MSPEQIAALVGMRRRTVYRWLAQAQAPSWQHQVRSRSVIEPYQAYVLGRWQEGCPKGSVLSSELKEQGYRGSERAVYRSLTSLRTQWWKKDLPSTLLLALSSK